MDWFCCCSDVLALWIQLLLSFLRSSLLLLPLSRFYLLSPSVYLRCSFSHSLFHFFFLPRALSISLFYPVHQSISFSLSLSIVAHIIFLPFLFPSSLQACIIFSKNFNDILPFMKHIFSVIFFFFDRIMWLYKRVEIFMLTIIFFLIFTYLFIIKKICSIDRRKIWAYLFTYN